MHVVASLNVVSCTHYYSSLDETSAEIPLYTLAGRRQSTSGTGL
jgi:hypothetical protein